MSNSPTSLAEDLQDFKQYFEFTDASVSVAIEELRRKEFITKKAQLFRLDDTSWKCISMTNLVVRDALEAWINDEIVKDECIDNIMIDSILETVHVRCQWDIDQTASIVILLTNMGIAKFKQLKPLRKKSLYALGIPVLLAQELRDEVKCITKRSPCGQQSISSAGFKLPIVGGPTPLGNLTTQMAGFSMTTSNRVKREVNGKTYEYDRHCPHKGADLTFVNSQMLIMTISHLSRLLLKVTI